MSSKKSQSSYSEQTEMTDAVLIVEDRKFYVAKVVSKKMRLLATYPMKYLLHISSKTSFVFTDCSLKFI